MTTFSIIIPVYNVAPYLRECLDSVLAAARTLREKCKVNSDKWGVDSEKRGVNSEIGGVEIICVDDGSTDGSGAILDEYAEKVEKSGGGGQRRITVLHQPNRGVSAARNAALDVATGEWYLFVDADDVLVPSALAKAAEIIAGDKYDAVFTGEPIGFEGIAPAEIAGTGKVIAAIDTPQTGEALLMNGKPLWGFPFIRILRMNVFGKVRFPVGIPNMEDSLSLIDVLAIKARWLWIDWRIYGYRSRPDSACHHITVEKVLNVIPCYSMMYQNAEKRLSPDAADRLLHQYGNMCWYVNEVINTASIDELLRIASAYDRCKSVVGFHLLPPFLRLRFWVVRATGSRFSWRAIRFVELWWNRIVHGIPRRLKSLGG